MSDAYATDTDWPAFARGDVLLVTNLTGLGIGHDGLDGGGDSVLRVLGAVDLGDGWRLTVEPYTGEEPTDG